MKVPVPPTLYVAAPFLQRIRFSITLAVIKSGFAFVGFFFKWRSRLSSMNKRPTLTKTYAPLPSHETRIFIPPTYKPSDPPLPLIIDIHGGGYCFGAPWQDDFDNCILSYEHGFCVVSIDYRMGPVHKFPTAPRDCAAMISAVLADESLPIDRSRVVVCGYSAGGNLALSATQILPAADKEKIKAVVAYYASTNQVPSTKEKIERQQLPKGLTDILHGLGPSFGYGYMSLGQDRSDPLLSPIYAERDELPSHICLVGCEYDMLCNEAKDMAEDLAEQENGEQVPLPHGRTGWTKGRVRWELLEGLPHGFNQRYQGDPAMDRRTREMHQGAVDWLHETVFR